MEFTTGNGFCFDGPERFKFYWHELRFEPKVFYIRKQGDKEIIIWDAFEICGLSSLCLISDNMGSVMYFDIIGTDMLRLDVQESGDTFLI